MAPGDLAQVLRHLPSTEHPDLLVGTGDDAAVWRVTDQRGLVVTADFITPVVDDPYEWGWIAAANSVSDVYAMGGTPLFVLNLVCWPAALDGTILSQVLAGAEGAAKEGGWLVVGGHTVDDPIPKFGLSVVGEVPPDRILTLAGLRGGDELVLSKALGIGVATTAIKRGVAPAALEKAAIASMRRLNREAAEVAVARGATGATDITGFGFLGHLQGMARASNVDVEVDVQQVPLLPEVARLAEEGVLPGGSKRNLSWVEEWIDAEEGEGGPAAV
ncbi:MAG: selenide, water dikinase SelD, partial [Acidimicrobiales bacterium]